MFVTVAESKTSELTTGEYIDLTLRALVSKLIGGFSMLPLVRKQTLPTPPRREHRFGFGTLISIDVSPIVNPTGIA